ncbi:uncharacterized protein [Clytia hemisphaerica]|uniref:uncharacterized protein n=1 Tax=Clytia hemisphaerica TaxID=252671 RepID=UPI0034D4F9D9
MSSCMKNDHYTGASRFLAQNTKKMNCPAEIVLRDIVKFPSFKAKKNTEGCKRTIREKIKKEWAEARNEMETERLIYGSFPDVSEHSGHTVDEFGGLSQQVDRQIISHIKELVRDGTHDTNEMVRNIDRFVKNVLFKGKTPPPKTNRRYYPKPKDVANHILNEENRLKFSKIDQENLDQLIHKWKEEYPEDHFHYRPFIKGSKPGVKEQLWFNENGVRIDNDSDLEDNKTENGSQLLIVHQTKSQQRLLRRYGNKMSLLDATHKTTKYAVPLFFVVVKTNVDYQVVASFATQDERYETILEALSIIKRWTPEWDPKTFMIDNCEAEIKSIETMFPDCWILICDFHREQAWTRWLRKGDNGMKLLQDEVLAMLRKIANASTVKSFEDSVKELKNSNIWKEHQHFRNWIGVTWLPLHEKWVAAFRLNLIEVAVNTNNGTETQNKTFKHKYLKAYRDKSLSGMMTVLVEQFLPQKYRGYLNKNKECSSTYKVYNSALPKWLHERPKQFIKHCVKKIQAASDLHHEDISKEGKIFHVKSENGSTKYEVHFGDDENLPSCTCMSWRRSSLPCKHMMSVLKNVEEISWESFIDVYRNSVFFNLDFEAIGLKAEVCCKILMFNRY